jgi:NTE family protein
MPPLDDPPPTTAVEPATPAGSTIDSLLALCLSGGGFRAALFHLGALRRLNELGILSKVHTISSVSGGSILAAHLATNLRPWPDPGARFERWDDVIESPFRRFVKRNIRTGPILKRFLAPWNWARPSVSVKALEVCYHSYLTQVTLDQLPERPNFVFCATDMVHGVSWVFERTRVGSYQAGYLKPAPVWPLARAVAASSCFPPIFSPLPMTLDSGQQVSDGIGRPAKPWEHMSVSDGGLYDNMGLQPVDKHGTVLVSDGGLPFVPTVPSGLVGRAKAYLAITGKQAGAVRKRLLIAQYQKRERSGAFWGIGSAASSYRKNAEGYSKQLATDVIARIRTDMDAFSEDEIGVLMNHGYLLADIALRTHAPHLIANEALKIVPFPSLMDESRVRTVLRGSEKRKLLGRG